MSLSHSSAVSYTLKLFGTGAFCFHCSYNSAGLSFSSALPWPPFFFLPSPQSNNYHQMQEEPCCGSAAHNTICYANTSRAPCQHGTSPRQKTGVWEMVTQAWYFLLQLLCPSPSYASLWTRAINIKWHEWNEDVVCLLLSVSTSAAVGVAVLQKSRHVSDFM